MRLRLKKHPRQSSSFALPPDVSTCASTDLVFADRNHSNTMAYCLAFLTLVLLSVRVKCFYIENANKPMPLRLESRDPSPVLETPSFPCLVQSNDNGGRLPTVLEQIVNERAEFQVNLGKAMDTLQSDMPSILMKSLGSYAGISEESDPFLTFTCFPNRLQHLSQKP